MKSIKKNQDQIFPPFRRKGVGGEVLFLSLLFMFFATLSCGEGQGVRFYPAPEGEEPSPHYSVKINNKPLFVYQARVSAFPINMWPVSFQRPLEQTELAAFACFDTDEAVDVEIESKIPVETVTIRPASKNIKPQVVGNTIRFRVKEPCQLVVEINDHHHALHLFVNPVERQKKNPDQYTLYFAAGRHQPGVIELKDNESVYIEGGAIVETMIRANNAQNITIQGRGIIDASSFERGKGSMIRLNECAGVKIEGVILKDSPGWALAMFEAKNVDIENVKLIGHWRYNADGIDIVNSQNVTVNNSFVRAFDDCICLKGVKTKNQSNVSNISVNQCVLWCDWGTAIQIGAETVADSIHHNFFRNCDIIHFHFVAMGIHASDRASIFDIHYENIGVEEPLIKNSYLDNPQNPILDISKSGDYGTEKLPKTVLGRLFSLCIVEDLTWGNEKIRGKIYNIRYQNIHYHSDYFTKFTFTGYDENHDISDLLFENIFINGKKVTNGEELISSNEYVRNVIFQ